MNDPRQLMLFPKPWDIWVEGYLCTGMEGIPSPAYKAGTVEAPSFDEAVRRHVARLPDDQATYWGRSSEGVWSVWGCRVYDNEADARRSFG